eukprot:TRINITY_DN36376_c0_g1_i2.p1 TRINITY_DN36376_c0_g1~~TRINITY_DN36376_c0_g1_i2.p1  ORF type:complete len:381 (+),score=61.63 TRINITY_DN36376_c0_g1_i2:88-1230(+)
MQPFKFMEPLFGVKLGQLSCYCTLDGKPPHDTLKRHEITYAVPDASSTRYPSPPPQTQTKLQEEESGASGRGRPRPAAGAPATPTATGFQEAPTPPETRQRAADKPPARQEVSHPAQPSTAERGRDTTAQPIAAAGRASSKAETAGQSKPNGDLARKYEEQSKPVPAKAETAALAAGKADPAAAAVSAIGRPVAAKPAAAASAAAPEATHVTVAKAGLLKPALPRQHTETAAPSAARGSSDKHPDVQVYLNMTVSQRAEGDEMPSAHSDTQSARNLAKRLPEEVRKRLLEMGLKAVVSEVFRENCFVVVAVKVPQGDASRFLQGKNGWTPPRQVSGCQAQCLRGLFRLSGYGSHFERMAARRIAPASNCRESIAACNSLA